MATIDARRHLVFDARMLRVTLCSLMVLAGCAPPGVLRQPVRGASFAPVPAEFPPLPAVMERTGDAPIALPEPSSFTPIAAPRSGLAGRP